MTTKAKHKTERLRREESGNSILLQTHALASLDLRYDIRNGPGVPDVLYKFPSQVGTELDLGTPLLILSDFEKFRSHKKRANFDHS